MSERTVEVPRSRQESEYRELRVGVFFASPDHPRCSLSGEMDFCAYEAVSLTCCDTAHRTCHDSGLLILCLEQRRVVMEIAWVCSRLDRESGGLSLGATWSLRSPRTAHLEMVGLRHPSSNRASAIVVAVPRPEARPSSCCAVASKPRGLGLSVSSTPFFFQRKAFTYAFSYPAPPGPVPRPTLADTTPSRGTGQIRRLA